MPLLEELNAWRDRLAIRLGLRVLGWDVGFRV